MLFFKVVSFSIYSHLGGKSIGRDDENYQAMMKILVLPSLLYSYLIFAHYPHLFTTVFLRLDCDPRVFIFFIFIFLYLYLFFIYL